MSHRNQFDAYMQSYNTSNNDFIKIFIIVMKITNNNFYFLRQCLIIWTKLAWKTLYSDPPASVSRAEITDVCHRTQQAILNSCIKHYFLLRQVLVPFNFTSTKAFSNGLAAPSKICLTVSAMSPGTAD